MSVCFLGIDCTVLDSFYLVLLVIAQLQLWLILMACLCHLASALTNTDDILKVSLCNQTSTPVNLITLLKGRFSVTPLLLSHYWLT